MIEVDSRTSSSWLQGALAGLARDGCCVVHNVIDFGLREELRSAMYRTQEAIVCELGEQRLRRAGELGVLRLMLKFEPVFFRLLELPEILAVIDAVLSPTAILHLQNGFILPSFGSGETPSVFQNRFHRDFPRYLDGYVASVNAFLAVDEFTRHNGATLAVPGSQQQSTIPSDDLLEAAVPVECPAGSMFVFDSTLWHAAGFNISGRDRLAINQQFTHSWIKQQIDYVRALDEDIILRQRPRTQQLLGYYTRVVTSLDEYYQPDEKRLYRRGQG